MYWIYPAIARRGMPVIVQAETHKEAKEKIARSPEYDGGKVIAIEVGFYATLCENGITAPALLKISEE